MLEKGKTLFFVENGYVYDGAIEEIEEDGSFYLSGYGCCCEGACRIGRDQIGTWIFEKEKDAVRQAALLRGHERG